MAYLIQYVLLSNGCLPNTIIIQYLIETFHFTIANISLDDSQKVTVAIHYNIINKRHINMYYGSNNYSYKQEII